MPGAGLEIKALRCVLRRHSLSPTLLLHDMGELVGEQLLAARAVERHVCGEENLPVSGECLSIHRAGESLGSTALMNDHL